MGDTALQKAETKWVNVMTIRTVPVCGEHHIKKEWQPTTFEYCEEGLSIRVPHVYAWVCPADGEASFTAETVDEIIVTVGELLEPAKRARQRRSMLTEYIVSVGENTA